MVNEISFLNNSFIFLNIVIKFRSERLRYLHFTLIEKSKGKNFVSVTL